MFINVIKYLAFLFYVFSYIQAYTRQKISCNSENNEKIKVASPQGESLRDITFEEIKKEALYRQMEAQEKFHIYDMLKIQGLSDDLKWTASNWHYEAQKAILSYFIKAEYEREVI